MKREINEFTVRQTIERCGKRSASHFDLFVFVFVTYFSAVRCCRVVILFFWQFRICEPNDFSHTNGLNLASLATGSLLVRTKKKSTK